MITNEAEWTAATQPWERRSQLLNEPEDVQWAIDTVVPDAAGKGYLAVEVYGNEDGPSRADFYTVREPTIDMVPAFVWFRQEEGV